MRLSSCSTSFTSSIRYQVAAARSSRAAKETFALSVTIPRKGSLFGPKPIIERFMGPKISRPSDTCTP